MGKCRWDYFFGAIGCLLAAGALAVFMTGFFTPNWFIHKPMVGADGSVITVNYGLWDWCEENIRVGAPANASKVMCIKMDEHFDSIGASTPRWFHALRAVETVGMVGVAMSLLLSAGFLIGACTSKGNKMLMQVAGGIGFLASILIVMGVAIFPAESKKFLVTLDVPSVQYSMMLSFAGGIGACLASISMLLCGCSGDPEEKTLEV